MDANLLWAFFGVLIYNMLWCYKQKSPFLTTKLIECWLWIFTIFVCMSLGIWFHDRTYKNIEKAEKADYQNGSVRKSLRSGLQFPTTTSTSNSMVQNITESGVDVVEKCAQGQKVSICVIAIADHSTHTAIGQDLDWSTSTPLRSSTAWEWSLQSTPSLFHTNQ